MRLQFIGAHTSLEPLIRKNKCSRQTANAGDLHLLLERWGDVSELFWMGDFGDIPKKLRIFPFLEHIKLIFGVKKFILPQNGFFGGSYLKHFWFGALIWSWKLKKMADFGLILQVYFA